MSGASNVARGSFNTIAANQAAYIIFTIRNDISRSNTDNITFNADSNNSWSGDGEFKIVYTSTKHKKRLTASVRPTILIHLFA